MEHWLQRTIARITPNMLGRVSKLFNTRRKQALLVAALFFLLILHQQQTNYVKLREGVYETHFKAGLHGLLPSSDPSEGALFHRLENMGVVLPSGGCTWDIGANNGVWISNSYYLLHSKAYAGFLYEPGYEAFASLVRLYGSRPTQQKHVDINNRVLGNEDNDKERPVVLNNIALNGRTGYDVVKFRAVPNGLGSSFRSSNTFDKTPKAVYFIPTVPVSYLCEEYHAAISRGICDTGATTTTVLSVDTEGEGQSIMEKIQDCGVHFDIIITEGVDHSFMRAIGYREVLSHALNTVWIGSKFAQQVGFKASKQNKPVNRA